MFFVSTGMHLHLLQNCISFSFENSLVNFCFPFSAVNLVMDRIANRPRGFAFLRYATVEESQRAIEGMHGKVLPEDLFCKEYLV